MPTPIESLQSKITRLAQTMQLSEDLIIEKYFLPRGEYKAGPTNKEYVFFTLAP